MSEIDKGRPSRGRKPLDHILLPLFVMAFETVRLVVDSTVGGLALLGDFRVRCTDITFGPLPKSQPEHKKEVP